MKNLLTPKTFGILCVHIPAIETGFKTNASTNTKISITNTIMSIHTEYTDQHKGARPIQEGVQGGTSTVLSIVLESYN